MIHTSVLVTGANGFTGSHVVKALLQRGYKVRGYVRAFSNMQRLDGLDIPIVRGDITNRDALKQALQNIDMVIHTAAYVDLGIVDEQEMSRVNVEGTRTLLELASEAGIKRFVHCSTIGIFGDTQGNVVNEDFQRTQLSFSSAYDRTKFEAQKLVDAFHLRELSVVSVLPSGIMGSGDPHFGPVVELFLGGRLKLWAGGDRITGIVYVEDVAQLLILAAERGSDGAYYIASAGELTTHQMFEIMAVETGIQSPKEVPELLVRFLANCLDPIGRIFSFNPPLSRERIHYLYDRCVRVDATRACQELGWSPLSPEQTILKLLP